MAQKSENEEMEILISTMEILFRKSRIFDMIEYNKYSNICY